MSRLTKDVQIDALNRRVVARELDVAEIRAHLAAGSRPLEPGEIDAVGALLFPDCRFVDLLAMSDVGEVDLARLAPSEIRPLIKACQEVNADFFGMTHRLGQLA